MTTQIVEVLAPNAAGYDVLGKGQPTGQLDVAAHLHCRQRTYLPLSLSLRVGACAMELGHSRPIDPRPLT